MESAIEVRSRVLDAFERAEAATADSDRDADLTFVVVGAGPTGVEIAGQIGELARDTLQHYFKRIDPSEAKIVLVETADRILTSFSQSLSNKAARSLGRLGVTPTVQRTVIDIDRDGVTLRAPDGQTERVAARTVIWAAGVRASGLAQKLGDATQAPVDKAGRVQVQTGPDDRRPSGGDRDRRHGRRQRRRRRDAQAARRRAGRDPAGRLRGQTDLRRDARGAPSPKPFKYLDKGNLATIGRGRAIAERGRSGSAASPPGDLVRCPHLVPDRLSEPPRGPVAVGDQLPYQRPPAGLADHLAAAAGREPRVEPRARLRRLARGREHEVGLQRHPLAIDPGRALGVIGATLHELARQRRLDRKHGIGVKPVARRIEDVRGQRPVAVGADDQMDVRRAPRVARRSPPASCRPAHRRGSGRGRDARRGTRTSRHHGSGSARAGGPRRLRDAARRTAGRRRSATRRARHRRSDRRRCSAPCLRSTPGRRRCPASAILAPYSRSGAPGT